MNLIKKSIGVITLAFCIINLNAKDIKKSEVPANIVSSFESAYKGITKQQWEMDKDGKYEVNFTWEKKESSVTYSPKGEMLEFEQECAYSAVPKEVTATLTSKYAKYKVNETEMIKKADGTIFYEFEVKSGKTKLEVQISKEGKVLAENKGW